MQQARDGAERGLDAGRRRLTGIAGGRRERGVEQHLDDWTVGDDRLRDDVCTELHLRQNDARTVSLLSLIHI